MQFPELIRLVKFLGLLAGALLVLLGLVWVLQRKLIYFPMEQRVPSAGQVLPGALEVDFRTEDGLRLSGWFVPATTGQGGPTLLVFNGNAGHRAHRAPFAEASRRAGFAVLLFDYRGYGGNPGTPSEDGLRLDARAARAYLETRTDVDPRRIVYFGESLGAAVAVAAAAEKPPAALILRSPFTSLTDVGKLHYPLLPVGTLLLDRYPAVERIAGVDCPLLVLAGERDRIVPPPLSRALFDAAPREDKRFVIFDGADHNDYELLAGPRLIDELLAFVDEHVTDTPREAP